MITALIAGLAVAASGSVQPIRLAQPDFVAVNVPDSLARFCGETLAQEMESRGIRIVTARQIATLIGVERQRQLLGCGDDSTSCLAELANALAADGAVLGDLGQLGKTYRIQLRVVAASDGRTLSRYVANVDSQDQLIREFTRAAEHFAAELPGILRPQATAQVERSAPRHWAWIPAVVGGACLAVGGGLFLSANGIHQQLTTASGQPLSPAQADALVVSGSHQQDAARVLAVAGGLAFAGAAGMYLLGAPSHRPIALAPGPGGVAFVGTFP